MALCRLSTCVVVQVQAASCLQPPARLNFSSRKSDRKSESKRKGRDPQTAGRAVEIDMAANEQCSVDKGEDLISACG